MTDFDEYQLREFEHIAEAHFKTADAISSFFRYYLIIMSLPATAAAIFLTGHQSAGAATVVGVSWLGRLALGCTLIVVAWVGLLMLQYLTSLRMDGLLYARTVNAIRKYFYDRSDLPVHSQLRMRVLPQTQHVPPYFELRYFGPVVLAFLCLNTAYFVGGVALAGHDAVDQWIKHARGHQLPIWEMLTACVLFAALHWLLYLSAVRHRDRMYLHRTAIGIDIDGVLNTHREQFCKVLAVRTGKTLKPEEITVMPVHENQALNVDRCDEYAVFHDVRYWTDMPSIDGAGQAIKDLRNGLNFKICIFSYRPWPIPTPGCADISRYDRASWFSEVDRYRLEHPIGSMNEGSTDAERPLGLPRNPIEALQRWIRNASLDCARSIYVWLPWAHMIDKITHLWLYQHKMQYDRLVIEKGHSNLASQNARFANRFNMATRYGVRFFVEDDLEKAIKMAYICDVVFLLDHPYNSDSVYIYQNFRQLPANIIRVKTWPEIRRAIRRMA